MFNFIKKKILESFVKDAIAELPKYQLQAEQVIKMYEDEIINTVRNAIHKAVKEYIEKKLGIKFY